MKKFLMMLCMCMLLASNCFADQQEHLDKKYDFTQGKGILVVSSLNENSKNGITEFKIDDIFSTTFASKFYKPMTAAGFTVDEEEGEAETDNDLSLKAINKQKLQEWKSAYDVVIFARLLEFESKIGWVDGYTYTVPEAHFYNYYDSNGNLHTGTFYTDRVEYSPGHNVKYSAERVRFDVYDLKTDKYVWSRIDSRAKVSKQGHLYERILKSFFNDYRKLATK